MVDAPLGEGVSTMAADYPGPRAICEIIGTA
jgi:hypothetical protein